MAKIYKTTFKFRRGLAEEWERVNPILNVGEPGFETDTGKLKIGNGKDAWKELKYVGEDTHVEVASKLDEKGVEQVRLIKVNNAKHADSATVADNWSTPRKVEMTGDVTGQILSWDGSDLVIKLSVVDDSHKHTIENIKGLEDALLLKAPLRNPKFTGIPTAPTAEKEVSNTQIATTAFVHNALPKALKNPYKLQLAGREYDGSASVTIDKEDLQSFLEITNAIHFLGVGTKLPTSGNHGDLIIVDEKGYIWVNNNWFELGGGSIEFEDNDTTYVFKELDSKTGFSVTSYINGVSKETKTFNFDVYTKSQTDTAIAAAVVNSSHLKRQILKEGEKLEDISKPDTNTIYMVRKHAFSAGDIYEEYMYIYGEFELIGNSFVNLSDYYTKTEVDNLVNEAKADASNKAEEYVDAYFKKLNSDNVLRFYCIEDVTIVTNGVSTVYPANSNVEVKFLASDVWEIIPTSDNSILALNAFPGALGTYYSWLEGVKQFSNILFNMNDEAMYSKWNQGHQGAYKVQYAQYLNCIFWSDNPYISEVTKRTNYTLYYTSQLPLCYSTIPDNTFKAFYLAFNVNSDPNWGNEAYRDSFAKATWATQVFSYYGARTIGIFGHDHPDFNITLPKDCRGLMCEATAIENAGVFDAINVTNFGAKQGSWRDAFRMCYSLRNLYIKNLKVNLNISWSPINYDSIYFIISEATNTKKITISVSPYTYNLLKPADFELASSKNITIELLTTNYIEDRRLTAITLNGDGTKVLGDDGVYKTLYTQEQVDALVEEAVTWGTF